MNDVDLGEPTSFLDHVYLRENVRLARILWIITEVYSNQGFLPGLQKNCQKQKAMGKPDAETIYSWSYDMEDIANLRIKQLSNYKVATPCMDDHQFKEEEIGSVGELSTVCTQMVLKWHVLLT